MRRDLPTGTVTFLFTDVVGSTQLLQALGAEAYSTALAEHRGTLREAFRAHGGVEVDAQGDGFFVAFPTAPGALRAAAQAIDGLGQSPIGIRQGLQKHARLTPAGSLSMTLIPEAKWRAAHGGSPPDAGSRPALPRADPRRGRGLVVVWPRVARAEQSHDHLERDDLARSVGFRERVREGQVGRSVA